MNDSTPPAAASGQAQNPAGSATLFTARCERPLLVASFEHPQTMLSWGMARPGFQTARRVAWLEVRRSDLTLEVDAFALLRERLSEAELEDAVAMMTSRDVSAARTGAATTGQARAQCLATVGLNNAARAGSLAPHADAGPGTINLLAAVSTPLTQTALIEALSIAAEARTAAIIDLAWRVGGETATGTGTDCIVVAAPEGEAAEPFAGLHTEVGRSLAAAVYQAVAAAGRDWIAERRP